MTSEGQYAGSPAEAPSGGPTSDDFPPDTDGRRAAGRASAPPPTDGFPSSYAPPPPATPNGGSPFVVPAVRTFGSGSDSARPATPSGTPYGSARVPQAEGDSGSLPQRGASPYGSVSPGAAASSYGVTSSSSQPPAAGSFPPPAAGGSFAPPATGGSFAPPSAEPGSGSPFVPASGNAPEPPPRSAWAPQQAPAAADGGNNPFPLPQRTPASVDPGTIGEFDGFAAGTPGRGTVPPPPPGSPSQPPAFSTPGATPDADPATGRPPGLSAFGDQRVRVPGATLGDLPDAPPAVRPSRGDSGGFPTRQPAEAGFSLGGGPDEGSGFPLRGGPDEGSGFPLRGGPDEGSGFPLRGGPDEGSGFPLRGGPDEGSGFPLRGGSDDSQGSGFPLRGGGNTAFPTRRGESGGFPLRGAATVPPAPPMGEPKSEPPAAQPPAPVTDLPIRSQHAPFGPPPGSGPADGPSFNAFGPAADEQPAYGQPADSQPPYGRPAEAHQYGRPAEGQPLGRPTEGQPLGRPADEEPAYGRAADEQPAYGRAAEEPPAYGRAAEAQPAYGRAADEQPGYGRAAEGQPAYGRAADEQPGLGRAADDRPAYARAAEEQPHPYGRPADEQAPPYGRPGPDDVPVSDPFGRQPSAVEQLAARAAAPQPNRGGLPDPFGRTGPGDAEAPAYGSARPTPAGAPFGQSGDQPGYGQRSEQPAYGSARSDAPAEAAQFGGDQSAYGSARPASPAAGAYGSARPGSPAAAFGNSDETSPYGARPASPFGERPGQADERPPFGERPISGGGASAYGDRPASPASFDQRPASSDSPFGERPGSPFAERSAPSEQPFGERPGSPFGERPGSAAAAFGERPGLGDRERPGSLFEPRSAGPDGQPSDGPDEHALYRRPDGDSERSGGYPQRVPGAALGSAAAGSPVVAESRNGSVPAPRDPAEHSAAVGSARPVTASASVPSASRVAPVDPGEIPPPVAAPQARVYGRPASPAEPEDDEPDPAGSPESPFDDRPASGGFGPPGGFGSPAYPQNQSAHGGPGAEPGVIAPQSPARATARASASARVAPPTDFGNPPPGEPPPFGMGERGQPPFGDVTNAAPSAPPFADFTSPPPAGPPGSPFADFTSPPHAGPGGGYAPEQYSELTTDIAGRENPYAPPTGVAGDFGAMSRATVTPPSPDDTTNWPGPEQGRFDQFKPDSEGSAPAKPEAPRVRMLPILIAVVIGAVLLLGVALGIVYLVAGDKSKAISVSTGECVKRDGSAAVKADCGDASAFQVVSIVDDPAKCEDQKQPYVQNPTDNNKNQYLCLKPQS